MTEETLSASDRFCLPWLPMERAPRTSENIILCMAEDTIPDVPYVRTGSWIEGADAENLGYCEFAKYGGWFIFDQNCECFHVVGADEPRGWLPMPIGFIRLPTEEELARARKRLAPLIAKLDAQGIVTATADETRSGSVERSEIEPGPAKQDAPEPPPNSPPKEPTQ